MTAHGIPAPASKPAASYDRRLESLREVCNDFESLFLQQMLQSVEKGGLLEEDQGGRIVQGMFDDSLAQGIAEKGGIGVADVLFDRLKERL